MITVITISVTLPNGSSPANGEGVLPGAQLCTCHPRTFLTEFCRQTGLPEKFYGGNHDAVAEKTAVTTILTAKIGNTCLAFYLKERYEPSSAHLMMTRSDSKYRTPEKVFDACRNLPPHVAGKDRGGERPRFVKTRVTKR